MNTLDKIEAAEAVMLPMQQAEIPTTHVFSHGLYYREVSIPAQTFVLGHKHKTEHLNVMLTGRIRVLENGLVRELIAPQVFVSQPGVRKMVYAVEPTRWANVHPNPEDETDMDKLEAIFIEKSQQWLNYEAEMKLLKGEI